MKTTLKALITLVMLVNTSIAQTQTPTIKTTKISDNLYEFFTWVNDNNSVNTYAVIGADGILLIDAGYRGTAELIKEELSKLTDKKVKYIINTHYNGDHTGGNDAFGNGATIISHQACRDILTQNLNWPLSGLPNFTFQDSAKIYFNDEEIVLKYFPGHTSSDIIIHFKNANMVFLGDLIFSNSFPLVQPDGGYSLLEESISKLSTMFDSDTRILPSHGSEISKNDLAIYLDMMQKTKAIVLKAILDGKMPAEAKKNNILKDWRVWDSKLFSSINSEGWIDNLYSVLDEGKEMSAFFVLKRTYQQSGIEPTINLYKKLSSPKNIKHFFIENDFNAWGYELLAAQKTQDAIEVLKINTEMFPESWNAFDSLGEAYMALGNNKLAIKNYEISLELNPHNENGLEQLRKLKQGK